MEKYVQQFQNCDGDLNHDLENEVKLQGKTRFQLAMTWAIRTERRIVDRYSEIDSLVALRRSSGWENSL